MLESSGPADKNEFDVRIGFEAVQFDGLVQLCSLEVG